VIIPRSTIRFNVWKFPVPPHNGAFVVGVGHNKDPVSSVRGIDATSRNNKRLRGVTFTFQVKKHRIERQIDDSRHILTKHPTGSEFPDNSEHFRPEVAVIFLAAALPGDGKWLAWESTGNNVNCS
jgi:hypothetical protein